MSDTLEKHKYLLTIRVPYEALDDLQARQIAEDFLNATDLPCDSTVKLQLLRENKEPVGVRINCVSRAPEGPLQISRSLRKIMDKLPAATPTLTGEDAREFIRKMDNLSPITQEEYFRAKAIYEAVNRNSNGALGPLTPSAPAKD